MCEEIWEKFKSNILAMFDKLFDKMRKFVEKR